MNKKIALTKIASAILLTMTVTGCVRFKERTLAEGSFDYQKSTLIDKYDSGDFSHKEQRSAYDIRPLTDQQNKLGLVGMNVDIRPPTQLMPVLDGVLLDPSLTQTKIWFNAFKHTEQMEDKVWTLATQYLASLNVTPSRVDRTSLSIETGPVIRERVYGTLSKNIVHEEANYKLQLAQGNDKRSMSLHVDVLNYQQSNDGIKVPLVLEGRTKRGIEVKFINDLLEYAYHKQEELNAQQTSDDKPLPIKLGFDDNHQTAWIIDTEFIVVWNKLPALLQLMSFSPIQDNKNLGYFLVKFEPQDDAYWKKNGLNPINLESGEYFVQLGEIAGGETSLIWLDSDKKVLSKQQVTDLYLSITDRIRSVTLKAESQAKPKAL